MRLNKLQIRINLRNNHTLTERPVIFPSPISKLFFYPSFTNNTVSAI